MTRHRTGFAVGTSPVVTTGRGEAGPAARDTEAEVGDEESYYEVEGTLDDGRQVDTQLDEQFVVLGTEDDGYGDDD